MTLFDNPSSEEEAYRNATKIMAEILIGDITFTGNEFVTVENSFTIGSLEFPSFNEAYVELESSQKDEDRYHVNGFAILNSTKVNYIIKVYYNKTTKNGVTQEWITICIIRAK